MGKIQDMDEMKRQGHDDPWFLPVSFYFKVEFQGDSGIGEVAFREVSGLSMELELEGVKEGGANSYEINLPKKIKHGNLVLKRALLPASHPFIKWVNNAMDSNIAKPIIPCGIMVKLMLDDETPLAAWSCAQAYPVKWSVETFHAEKNEIAVESVELTYTTIRRDS